MNKAIDVEGTWSEIREMIDALESFLEEQKEHKDDGSYHFKYVKNKWRNKISITREYKD